MCNIKHTEWYITQLLTKDSYIMHILNVITIRNNMQHDYTSKQQTTEVITTPSAAKSLK